MWLRKKEEIQKSFGSQEPQEAPTSAEQQKSSEEEENEGEEMAVDEGEEGGEEDEEFINKRRRQGEKEEVKEPALGKKRGKSQRKEEGEKEEASRISKLEAGFEVMQKQSAEQSTTMRRIEALLALLGPKILEQGSAEE